MAGVELPQRTSGIMRAGTGRRLTRSCHPVMVSETPDSSGRVYPELTINEGRPRRGTLPG
ncbi:hypothetical protein GCM10009629_44440 [Pseudonocardia alni]